ncbi:MarR family winged helix-turn-helix transcriptional regulator [Micromonospora sp. C28ISP2-4]|uniref:MarR family winged helix-turn-helix transcriptional regulator n=1 Tax=Micromonospora sp. C28ISP2-4 TaxID=3059523 RepID=UPI00267557AE|nr:MarR family winged helix-turn-helix transcriptional regulator [Micromonospora sp. C28ISP2-4]MDO3686209.1 MarR family winged helix-turn-helix transcriptional regulator [Micromonospora sp. C28ISP2-4]
MTTPHLSDAELASQPAAYWTGVAYESLIAFTRAQQAVHGFTQPQFWLLRNLSPNDLLPGGGGLTVTELRQAMASYLRAEDDLDAEAEVLLGRGWLSRDADGRLRITEAGEAARVRLKQHAPAIRGRIHEGVDDADYVTTLKVLRQMIRNTGGAV